MLAQGVLNDEAPVRQPLPLQLLLLQAVLLRQMTVGRQSLAHSKSRRPELQARPDRRRRLEDRLEEVQEEQLCVALLEKNPYVQLKKRLQMISS